MDMFIYKDRMSRLAMNLFSMFMFLIVLRRSPEFFECEGLIMPNSGVNILVMCFTMLGGGGYTRDYWV